MFFYAVLTTTKMKTLTTSAVNRCVAAILFQKIGVWRTGNSRKYRQSNVYIDQCDHVKWYLSLFRDFWKLIFKLKNSGEQEKESVPPDHPLSSLGKPCDAKRRSSGQIFLSYP